MAIRLGPGPVFAYEWLTASRRWQVYALRAVFIALILAGMAIVQTTQGIVQFYAQVGGYSFPSIGTAYLKARHIVDNTFGLVPVAYLKIAPSGAKPPTTC